MKKSLSFLIRGHLGVTLTFKKQTNAKRMIKLR